MNRELTYWIALAHTPKIWTARKNEIIVYCFNQSKTIVDFFESGNFLNMQLTQEEIALLTHTKDELGTYSFMVEDLLNQGYEIIPIISKEYSPALKRNLKYNSPVLLYVKGNKQILQENSIAIVGKGDSGKICFIYCDNIDDFPTPISPTKIILYNIELGKLLGAVEDSIIFGLF